jgi:hypothetical protein
MKTRNFGACYFERTIPRIESLSRETKVLDLFVSFENALKLNIAIDEYVKKLHRYDKNTAEGRKAAFQLNIYPYNSNIVLFMC